MSSEQTPAGESTAARHTGRIVISIDAMGGDRGAVAVVSGMADSLAQCPDLEFLLHGPETLLEPLISKRPALAARTTICHAEGVVAMEDKPSQV
ncbi:MAG: phosphate acyltransferase, partial [Rhodobacteraceae bacterium]|nr:phosphate acyltransferase [Paracoccaceae bacterium]